MSKLNEMTLYMAAVAVVEARKRDDKAWRDGGSARTDLSLAINTLEKAVELYRFQEDHRFVDENRSRHEDRDE